MYIYIIIYIYIYIYIYKRNLTSLKMHLRNGNWLMQGIFVARIQNQYKLAIFDMIKYLSLVQTPYFTPLKLYPAIFVTKFYLKHYFGDIQHQFSGTFFTPNSPQCKAYSSRFTNLRKVTPRQEINIARFKNHKILRKKIE